MARFLLFVHMKILNPNKGQRMIVVFYDSVAGKAGKRLWSKIQRQCPECPVKKKISMASLSQAFCRPLHGISIAILVPGTILELKELIAMEDLLENIRVILVLPDRVPTTISLGLKLRTCFFTFSDSDFTDVISVLKKILNHQTINQRRNQWLTYPKP